MSQQKLEDEVSEDCLIRKNVIDNLKNLLFDTIEDVEIINYIYCNCKRLLHFSMVKNKSREVALAIDLTTFDVIGEAIGSSRTVDIQEIVNSIYQTQDSYIIIHNHPSNLGFSYRDMSTFFVSNQIRILVVLGNLGSVYIVEKKKGIIQKELISIRKTLFDWKHGSINSQEMYEQLSVFGIVYKEL